MYHAHIGIQDHFSNLGALLRRVRLEAELEIEQVSLAIFVPSQQLTHIERGAFHLIPEEVYRKNIVKTYSGYLGLCWSEIEAWYEQEKQQLSLAEQTHADSAGSNAIASKHFWDSHKILKHMILGIAALACMGYLSWLGYYAISPPELVVETPSNNLVSDREAIVVSGYATEAAQLSINGISIARDREGKFFQEVDLQPGVNVITIAAAKKYSKETVVHRQIMWQVDGAAPIGTSLRTIEYTTN